MEQCEGEMIVVTVFEIKEEEVMYFIYDNLQLFVHVQSEWRFSGFLICKNYGIGIFAGASIHREGDRIQISCSG